MAYGKLAEGDRIWDSATDGDISSADMNELHDQLKAMMGPRKYDLTMSATDVLGDTGAWDNQGNANETIVFPIPLYSGQVVTEIELYVSGAAGSTAGTAQLAYGARGAAMTKVDLTGCSAADNFWDTGGVGTLVVLTSTSAGHAQLPKTIADDNIYYLLINGPTNASDARLYDVQITAQFGN
jgi:hypothetical protein